MNTKNGYIIVSNLHDYLLIQKAAEKLDNSRSRPTSRLAYPGNNHGAEGWFDLVTLMFYLPRKLYRVI